jgi:putative oxidoreductase
MNLMGKHITSIIRLALGTVFIYAGLLKINDIISFAGNIAAYQLLPYAVTYVAAAIIPWLEIVCGVMLICRYKVKAAAGLIILLDLVFIGALAAALARGLDIDCGCFKQEGGAKTTVLQALLRDIALLAAALAVFKGRSSAADGRPSLAQPE